jgi:hypothetical protein
MPWLSGGDRKRSIALVSSWRFFASVFWASVSSGLRGPSNILCRPALIYFQSKHFDLTQLRLGPLE